MSIQPILDTRYPALILKASRRTIHHGALDVARSLGRLGVPVYAIVEDRYAPLAASRYVTKSFVWKTWPADSDAFLNAMSIIGECINRPTILFPIDDLSAIVVAENSTALRKWYFCPPLSWSPRQLANKAEFYSLCARIGTPIARTVVASSAEDIREFSKSATFPVVIKAAEQWRLIQDRFNVKIIQTRDSLLQFCERVNFADSAQIILQEYVPGDDWIYHGYCNAEANLYVGFTGKKLLDYPPGAGSTALGLSFANDTLRSQCEQFLRAVSYSGIIDIDCRFDHRDGQYKIMDCNPRVGMNFRMFEDGAGTDVVRAQHLNLTGRTVNCAPMVENKLFVVESYYLLSLLRGWGGAGKINRALPDSPQRRREFAWWSSDDMLPFIVMSGRLIVQTTMHTLLHMNGYARGRFKALNRRGSGSLATKPPAPFLQKVERSLARYRECRPFVLNYDKGMVCFTFDDARRSACIGGVAALEKYDVNGTFYVCGGLTGTSTYHTEADLRRLVGNGHELACHGFGHFSYQSIDRTGILADLQKNRAFFERLGYEAPRNFAYPYGHVSPFAKRIVAGEFVSVRGISPGINYPAADLALLKAFPLYSHLWTHAGIARTIAENAKRRGLLIFFSHAVRTDPGEYDTSIELLDFAVRTAVASGNRVVPVRDALPTSSMAGSSAGPRDAQLSVPKKTPAAAL